MTGSKCAWAPSLRTPSTRVFRNPRLVKDPSSVILSQRSRCPSSGSSAKRPLAESVQNPKRSITLKPEMADLNMASPPTEMNGWQGLYAGPYRLDKYLGGTDASAVYA